jgi:hypothetical protein
MLLDSTDGREVVWSNGRTGEQWAPDLYGWIPGETAPTLIFRDPNRNAQLNTVAVYHGKYVFEELFTNPDDTSGWRLWYVESRGAAPVLLDSNANDPQGLPVPGIWPALTDAQVTWPAVHQVGGQVLWSLRSYDFRWKTTRTLVGAPERQTEFWFPNADDRGRLAYSTVEYGPDHDPTNATYHVYLANLADDPIKPRQLDADGRAGEPVLAGDGDTVIWKSVAPPQWVGAWADLYRYSLRTGKTEQILFEGQASVSYQMAGNRYVAGWEWNSNLLVAYDLETNGSLVIEKYDARSPWVLTRAIVAGDMIVFIRGNDTLPGGQNKWLCYARLPPPGPAG